MIKRKAGFDAVAVLSAINVAGKVVDVKTQPKYIDGDTFISFIKGLATQPKPCYLFLDNLTMHHSIVVRDAAIKYGINLIFNASYSSDLNPVEHLWLLAKNQFRKDIIALKDNNDQGLITKLIEEAVKGASSDILAKWVQNRLIIMKS